MLSFEEHYLRNAWQSNLAFIKAEPSMSAINCRFSTCTTTVSPADLGTRTRIEIGSSTVASLRSTSAQSLEPASKGLSAARRILTVESDFNRSSKAAPPVQCSVFRPFREDVTTSKGCPNCHLNA